jgi:hypothetical protein
MCNEYVETSWRLEFHASRDAAVRFLGIAFLVPMDIAVFGRIVKIAINAWLPKPAATPPELILLLFCSAALGYLNWLIASCPNHTEIFDRRHKTVKCIAQALLPWREERIYRFSDIADVEVLYSVDEGANVYKVLVKFSNGPRVLLPVKYHERAPADELLAKIRTQVGMPQQTALLSSSPLR